MLLTWVQQYDWTLTSKKDFMILAKANGFRRALAEENGK